VTPNETKLIALGNALARSIGHASVNGNPLHCPKTSRAVPCTCGAGFQQAMALDEWLRAAKQLKQSPDSVL
jgi:hypothetical protein